MALSDVFFTVASSVGLASPQIMNASTGSTAGGVYMAKLGEFMFALDTAAFQQLQRSTEYRWSLLNRIGREPAAQFLGRGDDTIELSGDIYPHFRGGLGQIGALRRMAETGEPQELVYAFESVGQYAGRWAIKSLKEGRTVFFDDGTPRKIEFSVSLVAYGEDSDMGGMSPTLSIFDTATKTLFGNAGVTPPAMLTTGGFVGDMAASASGIAALPALTAASTATDVARVATAVATVATNAARVASTVKRDAGAIVAGVVGPAVVAMLPPDAIATARAVVQTAEQVMITRDAIVKTAAVLSGQPVPLRGMIDDYRSEMLGHQRDMRIAASESARIADSVAKIGGGVDSILAAGAVRNVARSADALDFAVTEAAAQAGALGGKISG